MVNLLQTGSNLKFYHLHPKDKSVGYNKKVLDLTQAFRLGHNCKMVVGFSPSLFVAINKLGLKPVESYFIPPSLKAWVKFRNIVCKTRFSFHNERIMLPTQPRDRKTGLHRL